MIIRCLSYFSIVTIVLSVLTCSLSGQPRMAIRDLRVQYLSNPLGVDDPHPVFNWKLKSAARGAEQTAYRVLVASDPGRLKESKADIWDSGVVQSSENVGIRYDGKPLQSGTRYHWTVQVWYGSGKENDTPQHAWFETGLMNKGDWQAVWISADRKALTEPGPAPHFRKEFGVKNKVASARLYISGLGYYDAWLNGKRIGDHQLDPAVTRYDRKVLYVTYDVTQHLQQGDNAIGVILGTGWYNFHTGAAWDFDKAPWRAQPVLKAQLEIRYADGQRETISTDRSWKVTTGPIVFDGIHNGETYDARLGLKDWTVAGTKSGSWQNAVEVKGPAGVLRSQPMPPIRLIRTLPARSVNNPKPGVYLYDFGQNIAGRIRLKATGPEGAEIVIRHGERLFEDGTLDQKELSRFVFTGETQTSRYILGKNQPADWSPSFTYHGFQYAEVTIPPGVEIQKLEAQVLNTDFEETGVFACSDTLLNRIHDAMKLAYLGNFHGYPTDCPHREKIGWSGDAQLVTEGALFNFDAVSAYLKWIDDFVDEQQSSGQIPGIIPTSGWGYTFKQAPAGYQDRGYGPQWEGAFVLIPWYLYQYTGDTGILKRYFKPLKAYLLYLEQHAESDHTLSFGIDDHKALNHTEPAILATGFFYQLSGILGKMAQALHKDEDTLYFRNLSQQIRKGYRARFYDKESGSWGNGSQTALSGTLYHGLAGPSEEQYLVQKLVADLEANGYHLETGVVGTKYMIDALTRYGRPDVIYRIASQRTFPSWGYWLEQGANTLWQNWDGSQSRNHVMFGSIDAWFYQALAGIRPDPENPGFRNVIIRPAFVESLNHATGSFLSSRGLIRSEWERKAGEMQLRVEIPANSTATVYLSAAGVKAVKESNLPLDEAPGVRIAGMQGGTLVLEIKSGTYHFSIHQGDKRNK